MAQLGKDDGETVATIKIGHENATVVVRLAGEIDLTNAETLRSEMDKVVKTNPNHVVFDLGAVTFMDSSGISLLLQVAVKVRSVEVHNPSALIRRVLDATGVGDILNVQP
jgi:anti-sigma B factor antagonist